MDQTASCMGNCELHMEDMQELPLNFECLEHEKKLLKTILRNIEV